MPSRKNAVLEVNKNEKRAARNRLVKSQLKTARKKFEAVFSQGDVALIKEEFKKIESIIDKTVKKHVIPAGRGSRLISRFSQRINTLS